jgi:RimJ/RimL family protein N-acetyltransferase
MPWVNLAQRDEELRAWFATEQQRTQEVWVLESLSPGQLRLHVFQRNIRARTFYERRGFRAVEFGDGSANKEREPDVTYLWERQA